MSPETMLSQCPKAVVTSKPKREWWAKQEILDAVAIDETARVEETIFRGIYLVYSDLSSHGIYELFRAFEYSFIKRIIIVDKCIGCSRKDLESYIRSIKNSIEDKVCVRGRLRGSCKKVLDESTVDSIISSFGKHVTRKASLCLDVESFDSFLVVSVGHVRPCNFECEILEPLSIP
jgi:hypothetical protein